MESKVLCEAPWEERKSQANIINWRPPSPMLYKNSSLVFFRHTNYQNVSIMHRESLAARCCKKIPVPQDWRAAGGDYCTGGVYMGGTNL